MVVIVKLNKSACQARMLCMSPVPVLRSSQFAGEVHDTCTAPCSEKDGVVGSRSGGRNFMDRAS